MASEKQISYKDAGVDIEEGARAVDAIRASVQSTYRKEVIGDIGGFGGLFSAAALKDMEDPILVSGTDGVGTKLQLAKMANNHSTIGIDLVAMCVNDVLACGAEPLFFLDYIAVGKLETEQIAEIVSGVADGCKQASCSLVGGEIAEHPGVMPKDDYDVSGFCVGVVDRPKMIGPHKVKSGDVVLGLASSGIHSNGFSLVRSAVTDKMSLAEMMHAKDFLDGKSIMHALLKPTKIYVKSILNLLKKKIDIHAVAHITGGGITENLNRALPDNLDACVEIGSWPVLPIINYVVQEANLSSNEGLKTFNMGIGMCVICSQQDEEVVKKELESSGETVYKIGNITSGSGKVVYRHV